MSGLFFYFPHIAHDAENTVNIALFGFSFCRRAPTKGYGSKDQGNEKGWQAV